MGYDEALAEALAAANAQGAQQQMAGNIQTGNNAYNQMAQIQAAAKNMERQRLAQRMQDIGLGAPSSMTIQNNSMMAGQRDIGDIGRANQNYADTVNSMIGQTNANAAAQGAGFTAGINEAQANSELEQKMQEFERLYRLYTAKRITRNQFKAKTGLTVNGWEASRPKPPVGIQFPMTVGEATEKSRNEGWSLGR
jgi:hypothetical protein